MKRFLVQRDERYGIEKRILKMSNDSKVAQRKGKGKKQNILRTFFYFLHFILFYFEIIIRSSATERAIKVSIETEVKRRHNYYKFCTLSIVQSPETVTSYFCWTHLSRFHLKTEIESSLEILCFKLKKL
jgi:hypothetical protein